MAAHEDRNTVKLQSRFLRFASDRDEPLLFQTAPWTQKLSDQLNLAHVARKNKKKEKVKQTNESAHLIQYSTGQ